MYQPYPYFESLKHDFARNRHSPKSLFFILHYRTANWLRCYSKFTYIVGFLFIAYYKILFEWFIGIEIPATTRIGPGLVIHHGYGIVVHPKTVMGRDCVLLHGVTMGVRKRDELDQLPTLGDKVEVGAGSMVLGGVTLGDGVIVGAATMVTKDVPTGAIVVGNPMRILEKEQAKS